MLPCITFQIEGSLVRIGYTYNVIYLGYKWPSHEIIVCTVCKVFKHVKNPH